MDKDTVKKYFKENASTWLENCYEDGGYTYPVAHHRTRIVLKVLSELNKPMRVMDLGCGGGNLAIELAKRGHTVVGIDESEEMIRIAQDAHSKLSPQLQEQVKFICQPFEDYEGFKDSFDAVVAMGVIGYLPSDEALFNIAKQLLKSGGLFLVSCRNKLFNMTSITHRTIKEIEQGEALSLISEIEELYEKISPQDTDELIKSLKEIVKELPDKTLYSKDEMLSPSEKKTNHSYTMNMEARQHTPKRLAKSAQDCGFKHQEYYGVHPHIIAPRINWLLPPKIFNKLSMCFEALEQLPVSLIWSSVFLGVFKKES